MVTIIDPHLKRDDGFSVYREAKDLNLLVKDRNKNDFDGWCWPGSSAWTDYINPAAREWWSSQFGLDKYAGSSLDLFTWNDMNEPSVFNGPEITMHKDAIHYGGWEHRDVHNVYGMLQHSSTYEGHLFRTDKSIGVKLRPFVLSRAFFVGTQRYGAIWTGDNMANWEHLESSVPMLLSVSTGGIAFAGGGLFA
jgi:alpha 1,3-glucosidase